MWVARYFINEQNMIEALESIREVVIMGDSKKNRKKRIR